MARSFRDWGTREAWDDERSKWAMKTCPAELGRVARRKLDQLNQASELLDLRVPPNNRLEALMGGRKGQHSIRINHQCRVYFRWSESGPEDVEIVDYHRRRRGTPASYRLIDRRRTPGRHSSRSSFTRWR
jgi:proteic killer suppression protein